MVHQKCFIIIDFIDRKSAIQIQYFSLNFQIVNYSIEAHLKRSKKVKFVDFTVKSSSIIIELQTYLIIQIHYLLLVLQTIRFPELLLLKFVQC